MKKTLSLILSAVLVLSTLVSLIIPVSAEGEGDWDVMLSATDAEKEDQSKKPLLPGYFYDETGFHTVSPDYTNFNPKFTVISKEMYDIKNFSMTIVVHDYATNGDNWLSFSVWSESNGLAQGDVSGKYGDGWTSLIRPNLQTGELNRFESWNQTKGGRSGKQAFSAIDNTHMAPIIFDEIVNESGDRVITFSIESGVVKVNGVSIGSGTDKCIADRFKEGLAYVGVTLHNTDSSGKYHPTISIVDVNGETPTGTDCREPEHATCGYPPLYIPPKDVPYGEPAIWFDATLSNSNHKMPDHNGCELTWADDNTSFLVNLEGESFRISFSVRDEIHYEASDFPCFAIIFKNFCTHDIHGESPFNACPLFGENTTVWYYSGEHTAPNADGVHQIFDYFCVNPLNEDGSSAVDDFYTVAIFEINNPEYWQDRIHGVRLDVNGLTNYAVEGHNSIEILGAGFFRSGVEASKYISNMQVDGNNLYTMSIDMAFWDCINDGHYSDYDNDGYCDICWEETYTDPIEPDTGSSEDTTYYPEETTYPYEDTTTTPTYCHHIDDNFDGICDLCGKIQNTGDSTGGSEEISTEKVTRPSVVVPTPVETEDETTDEPEEEATVKEEKTTKDDIYGDSDAPLITIEGCEMSASLGIVSIVAIIGAGIVIKKKED